MVEVSNCQIEEFAQKEFPGKPVRIGNGYWYVQAGTCLGENLHYEFYENKVHLHIEGPNWRGIRDFLRNHITDARVSHRHWGRYGCDWVLDSYLQSWDDVKNAFVTMAGIMNQHILNYEKSLSVPIEELSEASLSARFTTITDCLQKNLVIPEYQRPYRWSMKNVEDLLNDIKHSQISGKQTYLIGTVIFHCNNNVFNIVDGQQRISTLVLLLKHLDYKGSLPDLKFKHSVSFAHVQQNYSFIEQWLNSNIKSRGEFLNYIVESCQFVEIYVKKLNEAFQMFESQNGRGKELEAYNLLKAYHIRAMISESYNEKVLCDKRWEDATMYLRKNQERIDILDCLFNEQLYRSRVWSRGQSAYKFGKKQVDEFKGVTLSNDSVLEFVYQNTLIQQIVANQLIKTMCAGLFKIKGRFVHGDSDNMNPFVSINQLILNGKSFFEYIETYVEIYKRLFLQLDSSQLAEFKNFYKNHCLYESHSWRKGDGYIREVYKSAVMMLFDRFGEIGVNYLYQDLYLCIYKYRLENRQVRYKTMAKSDNVAWIFQNILNAKSLSDLSLIKQKALEAKEKLNLQYKVEKIIEVFNK